MKKLELLKSIQYSLDTYGDGDVFISCANIKKFVEENPEQNYIIAEPLYLTDEQKEDGSFELIIRDFPY